MPPVTRSEAKDPLSGLMRKMSLMTKPKTPRTKKTVASDDMLANMLSGLTLGKGMKSKSKSKRRRGTGFSRRKTHKPKSHTMDTTGGRRRRRRGRRHTRRH